MKMSMCRFVLAIVVLTGGLIFVVPTGLVGQGKPNALLNASGRRFPLEEFAELSPEQETKALQFCREHHPELIRLLTGLKRARNEQYQRAIQQISFAAERLERSQSRFPERYELELELWKTNSRLHLLVGSLAMADQQEELLQKIKKMLTHRHEIQRQLMQKEREFTLEKLQKLEKSIARNQADQAEIIERQLERITRTYQVPAGGQKFPARNRELQAEQRSSERGKRPEKKSDPQTEK